MHATGLQRPLRPSARSEVHGAGGSMSRKDWMGLATRAHRAPSGFGQQVPCNCVLFPMTNMCSCLPPCALAHPPVVRHQYEVKYR